MLTLYIANKNYSSWSLRSWVLLTQLGIPFDERLVPFGSETPFASFSPTGKVPCLVDGDITVWDSLAIAEYIAEKHPTAWPADAAARAWARSACAEMHAGFQALRNVCTMNCGLRVALHEVSPALAADWARIEALWADGLSRFGGPWLAGSAFTAVDAFFAPVAFRAQTYSPVLSTASRACADRLLALPAMSAWYEAALAETWREPHHESDARAAGVWLQDLRARAAT